MQALRLAAKKLRYWKGVKFYPANLLKLAAPLGLLYLCCIYVHFFLCHMFEIMLSKEKFAQRCTILNCDPNLGINLEGLFHLYNTLSPSYLDNDYGIIFHKPETPGNISAQGWANMPVDYDSVRKRKLFF